MSDIHYTKDGVYPEINRYVLIHYNGGNWIDSRDQEGCEWVVARFAGLNEFQCWDTFGPSAFFDRDVDKWTELPRI